MKKIVALAALAVCVVALAAAPALAEGYNDSGRNFTTGTDLGYGQNSGLYVRYPAAGMTGTTSSQRGPHGGYSTTTNKCQDCHSTHYATGSYMLLRANDRTNACSFCHTGGGGSKLNIMMDQPESGNGAYRTDVGSVDNMGIDFDGTDVGRGLGVGHTLGYQGNAPADINPAFTDADGFACFDCHSPHGNSARIMTTFSIPGRAVYEVDLDGAGARSLTGWVTEIHGFSGGSDNAPVVTISDAGVVTELVNLPNTALTAFQDPTTQKWCVNIDDVATTDITALSYGGLMGVTPEGNVAFRRKDGNPFTAGAQADAAHIFRPVWVTGSFLLLKNPDNENGAGKSNDTSVAAVGSVADNGYNKMSINWDDPLGPADAVYGGNQDGNKNLFVAVAANVNGSGNTTQAVIDAIALAYPAEPAANYAAGKWFYDRNDTPALRAWQTKVAFPGSKTGILAQSEFCQDCHDGAAGSSTQAANVWYDNQSQQAGTYINAYSHDAQPRH